MMSPKISTSSAFSFGWFSLSAFVLTLSTISSGLKKRGTRRNRFTVNKKQHAVKAMLSDVITQILNFGQPASIDVQFSGANVAENYRLASVLQSKVRQIDGAVDVHIQQRINQPTKKLDIDRAQLQ